MPPTVGFDRYDWLVLAAYALLLIGSGVYFSLKARKNTEEYFLGGHRMPVWAVAFSVLATAQSAATFVGVPQGSYTGDLTYLSSNIGGVLAALVLAAVFIPAYYRLGVTTPYQLLHRRFGPGAKTIASVTYMIGRVFAGGSRLFIGALPFSLLVFGDTSFTHVAGAVLIFTIFGILYTLFGGISSVIWTDVIQVAVYLGAALVLVIVLLHAVPADLGQIVDALRHPLPPPPTAEMLAAGASPIPPDSKLTVLRLGLDFSKPGLGFDPAASFTLLTAVFGFTLLTLASHGADQDLVQRMLTCRSPLRGSLSVISGVLIGVPTVILFLVQGLLLYVFYHRPDLMGAAAPLDPAPRGEDVVMTFAQLHTPAGVTGLVLAGLLAAGPCGINSSLNAMSSTFVSDVYRPRRPGRSEAHYVTVGRWGVVGAGVLVGLFAAVAWRWYDPKGSTLIDFALGVMSFAYAGLLGVFLSALFTRRGSVKSCIASIITGFVVITALQPFSLKAAAPIFDRAAHALGVSPGWSLVSVKIAFPWQLVIGTIIAFAVCQLGRTRPRSELADPAP